MKLIEKIEDVLINFPSTRNSDAQLLFRVIEQFYNDSGKEVIKVNDRWYFSADVLKEINQDDVKRYRARFNSQGLYLPTEAKVIKARKIREVAYHNEFSPSNPADG